MSTSTKRVGNATVLRALNDGAALEALFRHGPMTSAGLQEILGLSKPATATLVARLEAAGLVERSGHRDGRPGPRAVVWTLRGDSGYAAGVDVTVGQVSVVVADLTDRVLGRSARAVAWTAEENPSGALSPGAHLDVVRAVVDEACARAGISRADLLQVVVGFPGSVDPATGRLAYAPHLAVWNDQDVGAQLAETLGVRVAVENDVNLVALAEVAREDLADVRDLFVLWVDQGVGAATLLDRRIRRGRHGGAGEIDHVPVPDPARRGRAPEGRSTVADLVRLDAVARLAQAYRLAPFDAAPLDTLRIDPSVGGRASDLARSPQVREAATLALAAAAADPSGDAGDFLDDLARRLAVVLSMAVGVLDPDAVVLGGEVAAAGGEALRARGAAALRAEHGTPTSVLLSTAQGDGVVDGALAAALGETRRRVFGAGSVTAS
ncbi:ROK family transcriptional regulator [Oerskovia rustica]|uniref:ROK family transcriptional regulator n=1 Tax=Oerskovia rustica TaxID=2762237 RepID=A0ABR8RXI3_9CELL|nr:ROK family transcriptional regulator [Oerskovia rustica]MBD7952453.1 ROK family transcriptional regulator [Oerskovia rustica]